MNNSLDKSLLTINLLESSNAIVEENSLASSEDVFTIEPIPIR